MKPNFARKLPQTARGNNRRRGGSAAAALREYRRTPATRGRESVAAEGGAVHARADGFGRALVGDENAERNSAGDRLGRGHDIRHDRRVDQLVAEVGSGPADAALDFVEAKQSVVFIRQFARAAGEFRVDRKNAAFALDPFDADAGGSFADGGFERRDVVWRNESDAGHQRLEILAVFRLAGDGKRAEGAAVKGIFERNDLELVGRDVVAVGLDHLERAFGGFGAAVGEKGSRKAAHLRDAFGERSLVFVVEEIRSMDQARSLFLNGGDDARMVLSERIDADAGDEIEIALAVDVPHVRSVAAHKNERMAGIVLQEIAGLKRGDVNAGEPVVRMYTIDGCGCHLLR